ncbi:MAG TPA: DUF362 domain-containing protein [Bryobacteraceae bacterium]|jgi:hypothetical protein|nr:DUF362 domain-containing protein [Bryobacteraceae bacterium]
MHRRTFLQLAAAAPAALAAPDHTIPNYRVVSHYQPAAQPGMPGPYPGHVAAVHAEKCIDEATEKADAAIVREMMARGMRALTGDADVRDAWARFITPADVVGIKVNCSGAPGIMSSPVVVGEVVRNLMAVGIKPAAIWIYERFEDQLHSVHYDRYVPEGVHIWAAETQRGSTESYDPATYVEALFFGEDDTRSNLIRLVGSPFTKIINVPNMKDHGASGVTGCLKNIAYGNFSNVARSHAGTVTNTYSFIGTLAMVEPLRSRTVLEVMDGLRGVWHGGPFSYRRKFRFYPKRMLFGTDPVAVDRLLIDIIDDKRKAEHAISVWDRSPKYLGQSEGHQGDPNVNEFVREPGHIEYAAGLGLGVYDLAKIKVTSIEV